MIRYEKKYISECCLEYSFGDSIDETTNNLVIKLYKYLQASPLKNELQILDIIPSYNAIAIHFGIESKLFNNSSKIDSLLASADAISEDLESSLHEINVNYNGVDIQNVCKQLNISKEELIVLHANKTYSIAMIGFRPYFPYLLGLDEKLFLPRRDNPRTEVTKGSVAIAAGQTGIYSQNSPGGWHIIGHTDFQGYNHLKTGDRIIFRSI